MQFAGPNVLLAKRRCVPRSAIGVRSSGSPEVDAVCVLENYSRLLAFLKEHDAVNVARGRGVRTDTEP